MKPLKLGKIKSKYLIYGMLSYSIGKKEAAHIMHSSCMSFRKSVIANLQIFHKILKKSEKPLKMTDLVDLCYLNNYERVELLYKIKNMEDLNNLLLFKNQKVNFI